jgi:uncharacterized membrane protein YfcA
MSIIKILVISIFSFLITLVLPWYAFVIVCFVVGFIFSKYEGNNFFAGFIGVGLFWLIYMLFLDFRNKHVFSSQIAQIFSESLDIDISNALLMTLASIIAGFLGALSCWCGALLAPEKYKVVKRRSSKSRYELNL